METTFPKKVSLSGVVVAGFGFRMFAFAVPLVVEALQRRPEITTCLTSFRSLKEGAFLYERGANPYIGGTFYHPPIYLTLFSWLIPVSSSSLTSVVWSLADVWSAYSLVRIHQGRGLEKSREALVAGLYLFNPYTILTGLAKSTTSLDNSIILFAIAEAVQGRRVSSLVALSVAVHISLYPILLLPPVLLMIADGYGVMERLYSVLRNLTVFVASFATLAVYNHALFEWHWAHQTWGVTAKLVDLTPNAGMWWYFFTEMFDHFRTLFLGIFQLQILIYVVPVCTRFWDRPLISILILMGVFITWKSYPSLGDMALWAGLLGCFPDIVSNLRHPLLTITVHLYTSILLPLLHSLWLLTGTGNANFYYAATMVYGLNASLAVVDVLGAALRADVKTAIDVWMHGKAAIVTSMSTSGEATTFEAAWEKNGWQAAQFTS